MLAKFFDRTFWKFVLIGVVNTLFGTAIMFVFYNLFHFSYWVSSASNYVLGSILSYFLNRSFTFQDRQRAGHTLPRFIINICVCYFLAYGLAKPAVGYVLSGSRPVVQENIAMLAGMCLFVAFNYVGQRFFVFKNRAKG